jgi:hypothetical protein
MESVSPTAESSFGETTKDSNHTPLNDLSINTGTSAISSGLSDLISHTTSPIISSQIASPIISSTSQPYEQSDDEWEEFY